MKIKKRYLLLTPAILLLGALPSNALSWQQLTSLINQVNTIKNEFMAIYENFDERIVDWLGLEEYAQIDINFGDLGLPDIKDLEAKLKDLTHGGAETSILEQNIRHEEIRNIVRGKSYGTLSEQGQAQQKNKMDELGSNATDTMVRGTIAQTRITTQDVMKDLALQNNQISSSLSLMGSEIMDMSQKQDLANLSLSNISEGIDTQNLAEQNDRKGATYSILQMTGMISAGFHQSDSE